MRLSEVCGEAGDETWVDFCARMFYNQNMKTTGGTKSKCWSAVAEMREAVDAKVKEFKLRGVSEQCGLPPSTIWRFIVGQSVNVGTLNKLAEWLEWD